MFTTRPELVGTFGMVSSTHWLASSAGMAMLEKGGNAFDAAVAAGMVLQVAEPHLNGPGGDLPLILHRTGSEKMEVICGQGPAPAGATLKHYKNLGLDLVPGTGLLATVIPGAFDAWMLMLRDHGTLSLAEVFEPALHYASQGIPVLERIQKTISYVQQLLNIGDGFLNPFEYWNTLTCIVQCRFKDFRKREGSMVPKHQHPGIKRSWNDRCQKSRPRDEIQSKILVMLQSRTSWCDFEALQEFWIGSRPGDGTFGNGHSRSV